MFKRLCLRRGDTKEYTDCLYSVTFYYILHVLYSTINKYLFLVLKITDSTILRFNDLYSSDMGTEGNVYYFFLGNAASTSEYTTKPHPVERKGFSIQ